MEEWLKPELYGDIELNSSEIKILLWLLDFALHNKLDRDKVLEEFEVSMSKVRWNRRTCSYKESEEPPHTREEE